MEENWSIQSCKIGLNVQINLILVQRRLMTIPRKLFLGTESVHCVVLYAMYIHLYIFEKHCYTFLQFYT